MGRVLLACWLVWWAMPNIFTHLGGRTAGGGNPVQMPLFGEEGTQASESLPVPVLSTNVCSLAFFRPNRPFLGEQVCGPWKTLHYHVGKTEIFMY